jgi:hypothetical protein
MIRVSFNGWTDNEISLQWLEDIFEFYTRAVQKGTHRLLIVDGHGSYILKEFIQFCENHSIIALYLPLYTIHILQPLDVSVFAPLAKVYKKRVYDYNMYGALNIDKSIFLKLSYEVRKKAISDYNIASIFQKTGLYPFNPSIIFEKLRPRSTIPSNIIIIIDIFGNRVKITINYPTTAKKIDIIVKKIREGSRNSLLFEEFCNAVIKVKTDCTLAYKTCDDMIDAVRWRRRAVRFRKDYGKVKHLTVARIEVIEEESAAVDEVKRKEKERYWALYGKGKLA